LTKLLEIDTTISILTDTTISILTNTTILVSKPMKHSEISMKERIVFACEFFSEVMEFVEES
jgi:hypothetical protein